MLLENCCLMGAYSHTTKAKEGKPAKTWLHLSFKILDPLYQNKVGDIFDCYMMDPDKSDRKTPEDFSDLIGKHCMIDISNNFCNKVISN